MLACHLDLENADHRAAVRDFWDAPRMPDAAGLKAIDMFRAVSDGRIKALWIIHTNPAVSMPEADAVRDAIAACDFTVVSDITDRTDTARLADVLLPASAWAEKSGTVTNSDRTISRQRAVLPPPGRARADWDILAEVGRRMGFTRAFDYASEAEIFREHAALSGVAGGFGLDFDISSLSGFSDSQYDDLGPTRWPVTATRQGGRFFGDGAFFHVDGNAKMVPVSWRPPDSTPTPRYPFRLNTGRLRDQWHTMTRTALSPRLSAHLAEPFLEIHPEDAQRIGVNAADLVELSAPTGTAILRARITGAVQRGQVFAPMHWTAETAPAARIDALVAAACDPVSGQPESKACVVSAKRFKAAWYGFAVARDEIRPDCDYWALARTPGGFRAELAGGISPENWENEARRLFGAQGATLSSIIDTNLGSARIALHSAGVLSGALYVSRTPVAVMRDYLATLPGTDASNVLTGRPAANTPNPGPTLCSCFGVGINTIVTAIEDQGLISVESIGDVLGAGTNCGSCKPEIAELLANKRTREAAE